MKWSVRQELVLVFCVVALVPTLSLAGITHYVAASAVESKSREYNREVLHQAKMGMDAHIRKIEEISFNLLIDEQLQASLEKANSDAVGELEAIMLSNAFRSVFESHVLFQDEIISVRLESLNGRNYELNKSVIGMKHSNLDRTGLSLAAGGPLWSANAESADSVTLSRLINSTDTQRPLGYMVIEVSHWYLADAISGAQTSLGGSLLLISGDGEFIVAPSDGSISQESIADLAMSDESSYTFRTAHDGVHQVHLATSDTLRNGWRLVATLPSEFYRNEFDALSRTIVLGALGISVVAAILAVYFADSISKPIRQLSEDMRSFGQGQLASRTSIGGRKEFRSLARVYNEMASDISTLVDRVYSGEVARRQSELRLLRMQLNPHFLYNTLDTVNWMARREGAVDAGMMVNSLASLLRATLDSADNVRLREEIATLEHYIQIQQHRFQDKLSISLDIDPASTECFVPTLILQPLVENAIVHGIAPSLYPGVVKVKSRVHDGCLRLSVEDNGVGMAPDAWERANSQWRGDSIGLANVVRRVGALVPTHGRVEFISELGEGSTVTVILPLDVAQIDNGVDSR